MKFTALNLNLDFRALAGQLKVSIWTRLNAGWWVLLGVLSALLFLDGLLFYRYGFEPAAPPPEATKESVRLEENLIRQAALLLEERRQRFEAKPQVPADLPNPFR